VAASGYYPQLAIAGNYSRLQGVYPAPINGAPLDTGAANLTLRQALFNFGQTDAQVASARATADATEAQARLAAVQVCFGVRQAYLQWAQARALAGQTRAQVANAEQLLARARSFFNRGARPRIDVTRAEVVLAQARAAEVDARNQVEIARRTLETAVGGSAIAGEPVFPVEPALARQAPGALQALAQRVHPSLQAGGALVRASQANRQLAERLGMPDLSAQALGGMRAQSLTVAPDWQAGLNLAVPLFTGFSIRQQQEAATEAERAAEADMRDRTQQVMLGVDRAQLALSGAREKLAALNVALRSAQENYALAQNRYRDGVGSIIEVSEAQALLAQAQAEVVRGTGNQHLAIAELERAIGLTGLEPEIQNGEGR
jgi:outer membrane protein TolC